MLRVEAVVSGGIVPVPKRWAFEECADNAAAADELRRLIAASGFWSLPVSPPACLPDQQRLWLRVADSGQTREAFLPDPACGESMRALGELVCARATWSPGGNAYPL